ncbi:MAG: hypothetical protein BWY99_02811 [Synergistetes bacterium ADurb.BinA166]|jgi:hypothetical protein|nr:MAG: hypothetical protein BWY99_02811 [Synergistetes bacterium ADurb.BinA166]
MASKRTVATASLLVFSFLTLVGARPAHAYLDPAAGSLVVQILLGGIAGVALIFKLFWRRLRGLFSKTEPEPKHEDASSD